MSTFMPADILLPQVDSMERWSVVACDQFTSQPKYWEKVREYVGDVSSTLNIILPEVELSGDYSNRIEEINHTMWQYLQNRIFEEYSNAYIYVERTLPYGLVRKGIVGAVDLEEYDYHIGAASGIRATEKTVIERIPPRKKIRRNAPLELPHILLLCDDEKKMLIESVTGNKEYLPKVYDFDLMEGGGHISGWLLQGEAVEAFNQRLKEYEENMWDKYRNLGDSALLYAVGDGNHSLATAKACYEELKTKYSNDEVRRHPARYALVELENIHDSAQRFEAIHRIIKGTDPGKMLQCMQEEICAEDGYPVTWYAGKDSGTICLDRNKGEMAVAVLQSFLDSYLSSYAGEIDYIHGDEVLRELADEEGAIGFLLPVMEKGQLFRGVITDGVLPRKTFSMGDAKEKRYYLEARRIAEVRL